MVISWLWVPGESVGPFSFGHNIERIVRDVGLVKLEGEYLREEWDTFAVPGNESRVYADGGVVSSILCCDSLMFGGIEILGLMMDEVRAILGEEDEIRKQMGPWDAVYYYRLGLTLWIADSVVESATCERRYESGGQE
jgi:hypothetical protein